MENVGLEQRALLVSFSKSAWPGKAPDKDADKIIQAAQGNKAGTTTTTKWLVDEAAIKKVHQAYNAAYMFWAWNTTPWELKRGGARLANGPVYDRLMKAINTDTSQGQELGYLIRAAYEASDEFIEIYPRLVDQAKADLNGLYNPKNYPSVALLREQFKITVTCSPLPLSPESLTLKFLGLDDLNRLRERLAGGWAKSEAAAMDDLFKRLAKAVGHMAETLADPEAKFKDTLVGNIRELADLIPALNFKNDQELTDLAKAANDTLAAIDPETLRQNMLVRGQIAGEAGKLLKQITGAGARFIDLS
jgi:hypothetical protein